MPTKGASRVQPTSRWRRLLREAAAVWLLWHIGCVLATGAKPVRELVKPINGWYCDGLRMTNTWGMFSKPPKRGNVLVEVQRDDGWHIVSSAYQSDRASLEERVVDIRVRKIQAKLLEGDDRQRFGSQYLDYWCRLELEAHPDTTKAIRLRVHEPPELDDNDQVKSNGSDQTFMTRRCAQPIAEPNAPRQLPIPTKPVQAPK